MNRMQLRLPLIAAAFLALSAASLRAADPAQALDSALIEAQAAAPAAPLTAPRLRLIDTAFNILAAAGGSSVGDDVLKTLQGGAHDPKARGFQFQQGELSLAGAVDPWFSARAYVIFTPEAIEMEEAYASTTALPGGLQAKAGFFFAEFGRTNPQHPHSWGWLDQPVINTRVFGPEGLRAPGARLSWLLPLPLHVEASGALLQSDGAFAGSFLGPWHGGGDGHGHGAEESEGSEDITFEHEDENGDAYDMKVKDIKKDGLGYNGRPNRSRNPHHAPLLPMARLATALPLGGGTELALGASWAEGANRLGGLTQLRGADAVAKWVPASARRGYPFVKLEAEWIEKRASAPGYSGSAEGVTESSVTLDFEAPPQDLQDHGVTAMLTVGLLRGWELGLRYEQAGGIGDTVHSLHEGVEADSRWEDPLRQDRSRLSPLLTWRPSEYSRLRLQYNHDFRPLRSGETVAHSVWFGTEFLFGAHPAHKF